MNIQAMHTAIEQRLQNINSYVFENFEPEEKDLFINAMQEVFIKSRLTPDSNAKRRGFEESGKRLADLQSLVKENTLIPVPDNSNPDSRRYLLASGVAISAASITAGLVYQIVSVGTSTFTSIGAAVNTVGTIFIASGTTSGSGTVALFDFFLPVPGASRANLVVNNKPLVIEAGLTPRYLGCLTISNTAPLSAVKGDFYIVIVPQTYTGFSGGVAAVKGDIIYHNGTTWSVKPYPVFNYPKYNVPIRIVEHEDAYRDQANPFAKPTERSPIVLLRENCLIALQSERFILKDVILTYIRKPQQVSLSSSKNCELPEHTHSEIIDLVVNHILEAIESRRYQSSSIESLKNE